MKNFIKASLIALLSCASAISFGASANSTVTCDKAWTQGSKCLSSTLNCKNARLKTNCSKSGGQWHICTDTTDPGYESYGLCSWGPVSSGPNKTMTCGLGSGKWTKNADDTFSCKAK